MDYEPTGEAWKMHANRKTLENVCVTCRRAFRFGESVARCPVCSRFQHADCWEGNVCPHAEAAPIAAAVAAPAMVEVPAVVAVAVAPAQAPAEAPVIQRAEDETFCTGCGKIIKRAALRCRFCNVVLNQRLAAAGISEAQAKEAAGNARESLIYGLLGLVICAPVFAPEAVRKGNAAIRMLDLYPLHDGPRGKAQIGIILGYLDWVLWGIAILTQVSRR